MNWNMNVCPQELFACMCVLKGCKSRELEMFLFCLWNDFTVSVMCLSIFYFSAYKTELELKLLENLVQILGKMIKLYPLDVCKPAHFFTNSLSARVYKFITCKLHNIWFVSFPERKLRERYRTALRSIRCEILCTASQFIVCAHEFSFGWTKLRRKIALCSSELSLNTPWNFIRTFEWTFVEKSREQKKKFTHFTCITFAQYCTSHSAPLFACLGILPIKMLYFKLVASPLHDIKNHCAPRNISQLFTRSEQVHSYSTRFSVAGSFYIKQARTNQLLSFSRVGVKIWNGIPSELCKLRKAPFKRKLTHLLLKILETEEMNVDMRYIDLSSFPAFSLTC